MFLNEETNRSVHSFLDSVRSHKRFRLRFTAIVAASLGSALNFLLVFLTTFGVSDDAPGILTGCAYIPLILSLIWHHIDFASKRLFRQEPSVPMIILVDGLGFLGFLTILIANGIVCSDLWGYGGVIVLMAYNSVPWMICCSIHGTVVIQEILRSSGMLLNSFGSTHRCSNCGHQKTNWGQGAKGASSYSLLGSRDHDEVDVEEAAGTYQAGEATERGGDQS